MRRNLFLLSFAILGLSRLALVANAQCRSEEDCAANQYCLPNIPAKLDFDYNVDTPIQQIIDNIRNMSLGICVDLSSQPCSSADQCRDLVRDKCKTSASSPSSFLCNLIYPSSAFLCENSLCRRRIVFPCGPPCFGNGLCASGVCSDKHGWRCCVGSDRSSNFGESCNSDEECPENTGCDPIIKLCMKHSVFNIRPLQGKTCTQDSDCTTRFQRCGSFGTARICLGNATVCTECNSDSDCPSALSRLNVNLTSWCDKDAKCCRDGIPAAKFDAGTVASCGACNSDTDCGAKTYCNVNDVATHCCLKSRSFILGKKFLSQSCNRDADCRSGVCAPYSKICIPDFKNIKPGAAVDQEEL
mmetsp:Transcript_11384/g.19482  ORF Transcript_11384/g.19482 Transcript_11384/m.19482 type:complete len:357 (+) Transcript_11384:186-1256(+)